MPVVAVKSLGVRYAYNGGKKVTTAIASTTNASPRSVTIITH